MKLEGNKLEGPEGLLKVTLPATIPQGEMRLATIVGRAKVGDATISIKANQRAPLINHVSQCAVASDGIGRNNRRRRRSTFSTVL